MEKKKKVMKPLKHGSAIAIATVIAEFIILYFLITAGWLGLPYKIIFCLASLIWANTLIRRAKLFPGTSWFWLAGTKKGIHFIDDLSKRFGSFWEALPLWGIVLGLGLLSYPFLKGRISKRLYVFGLICLFLMYVFVLPNLGNTLQFINPFVISSNPAIIQQASTTTGFSMALPIGGSWIQEGYFFLIMIFGFSGFIFALLFQNAASIISSLFVVVKSSVSTGSVQTGALADQIAGAAPIIPGITIPLVAGIIALAITLIVHEFSHGVLARRFGVRLKSIGIIAIGVIPLGAFVDPDEKMFKRAKPEQRTKILSAGIAANFVLTIVFFLLMVAIFSLVVQNQYTTKVIISSTMPGYPAYNVIKPGTQVLYWNGKPISTYADLAAAGRTDFPGGNVTIITTNGTYTFVALPDSTNSSHGLIGVNLEEIVSRGTSSAFNWWYFLYSVFALTFLINFAAAIMNILPIPFFDGRGIYDANVKSKKLTALLGWLLVAGVIINILPLIARI